MQRLAIFMTMNISIKIKYGIQCRHPFDENIKNGMGVALRYIHEYDLRIKKLNPLYFLKSLELAVS